LGNSEARASTGTVFRPVAFTPDAAAHGLTPDGILRA
jgi:hypothetical protein